MTDPDRAREAAEARAWMIAFADKIDARTATISGRDADTLASFLRRAARLWADQNDGLAAERAAERAKTKAVVEAARERCHAGHYELCEMLLYARRECACGHDKLVAALAALDEKEV